MKYGIDTGLIVDKLSQKNCCPICELKKDIEEKILHEYLNDAVMDDDSRIEVGKRGFCAKHYDMLHLRNNKLSLALQIETFNRVTLSPLYATPTSPKQAKKLADKLLNVTNSCVICDSLNELLEKYCQAIAKLFVTNKDLYKLILASNGFCSEHYAMLIKYASGAGMLAKNYLSALSTAQQNSLNIIAEDLNTFCVKHDYRNSLNPLGKSGDVLVNCREKLYGKDYK